MKLENLEINELKNKQTLIILEHDDIPLLVKTKNSGFIFKVCQVINTDYGYIIMDANDSKIIKIENILSAYKIK